MPKTLTLRLTDHQSAEIERLQEVWQFATASKAVLWAVQNIQNYVDGVNDAESRLSDVVHQNHVLTDRIESARAAAAQLLEKVAQVDITDTH